MLIKLFRIVYVLPIALVIAQEPFTITIATKYSAADCTSGYLSVNGLVVCYALEKPQAANIPLISAIPAGAYPAHLRYDHADRWRIELDNVPDRKNVQIHVGNFTRDTEGCILVGDKIVSTDLCTLIDSATAYKRLKRVFYGSDTPNATPDKSITVRIQDVK